MILFAELSFEDWCDQEEGRLVSGAGRSLYDARVAPACTVLSDDPGPGEVSLSDGLRFVYDTMPWVDVGAIREEILVSVYARFGVAAFLFESAYCCGGCVGVFAGVGFVG